MTTGVSAGLSGVERMLQTYDRAYASLTLRAQPTQARDFLLAAPDMFMNLDDAALCRTS